MICNEIMDFVCEGSLADVEVTETDLAEELPLCCCRMETPHMGSSLSTLDQTCMAMESMNGMVKLFGVTTGLHCCVTLT